MGMRPIGTGQRLGEPALEAQRGEQRRDFDHQHRDRIAADNVRAIGAAGDEQERQPGGEAQDEAENVGSPALGERVDVLAPDGAVTAWLNAPRPSSGPRRSRRPAAR